MLKSVYRIRNSNRCIGNLVQVRFFSRDGDEDGDEKKDKSLKNRIKIKKEKVSTPTDEDTDHEEKVMKIREENVKANVKAIYATKVGAMANVGLATSKCVLGVSIGSTALVADGVSSFGDLMCDGVVYYTVTEARKKSTPDRPWGSGKIEPLGALTVGALLFCTGVGIGYSAADTALDMAGLSWPHFDPSTLASMVQNWFSGTVSDVVEKSAAVAETVAATPKGFPSEGLSVSQYGALAVSGMSVFAKEALFRYTLKAGERANSSAVIANAWQHRADVSTSSAVFAGLVGSMLGFPLLDPLAGVLVSGVIIKQAYTITTDSLRDLSDAPASAKETLILKKTCLDVSGIVSVTDIQARKSGPYLYVEVTVGVDGSISASAAHRLAMLTKLALLRKHEGRVANAAVHVEPLGSTGLGEQSPSWARDHEYIVKEISKCVLEVKSILSVSEVQVYYRDNGQIAAKVDIVLPATLTISDAHIIAVQARQKIEKQLPGISEVDVDLELDETLPIPPQEP